ncbi:MAG: hypothetical protein EPN88_08705 [Bacteroidetes bacterium]|nr:MAG: hypothetical protein EPN88_08705 [Bacteroidota bacterium]
MNIIWFKKVGIIFIPISIVGVLLYFLTLGFCATVIVAIDRNAYSVSDFLYGIFPYIVSAFTILFWIASNTCRKKES